MLPYLAASGVGLLGCRPGSTLVYRVCRDRPDPDMI